VTLKQLEAFYWAATVASFSIAAKRLHLSQSSLSKRITELESNLGCELFDRDGHRATLTPKGRQLVPKARDLLAHAEEISTSVGADEGIRGLCRFGVGEIAASSWLPKLVANVKRHHPELSLEPYVDLGRILEERLIEGELDFAMLANQSSHPELKSVLIANVQFTWVISTQMSSTQMSIDQGRRIEDIASDVPIITMHKNAGSSMILDKWLAASNLRDAKLVVSNNMSAMAGLVAAGLGIGYFPIGWIRPLLDRNILRTMSSAIPLEPLEYRFSWRADDNRLLIQRLRELVLKEADYDQAVFLL
jgi:DNA-binding transcriptional LysR family regulator